MAILIQKKLRDHRFICLLFFLMTSGLFAQYPGMPDISKTLSKASGLPDEYITCITQDSLGYMWFGTPAGFCQYDGSEIKTWSHYQNNNNSLPNNWVLSLQYDHLRNQLWVGTAKGLSSFDLQHEAFSTLPVDSSKIFDPATQWITGMLCDRQNDFWIYNHGLLQFDRDTKKSTPYFNDYNSQTNLITQVLQDIKDDNILWLGTMGGYVKFHKKSKTFEGNYIYPHEDENVQSRINQIELCMYQHDDGKIFGGALNGGMTIFDPYTEKITRLNPQWKGHEFSEKLHYKSIIRINKNLLCIGTNDGVIWYNPTSQKVINFFPDPKFQTKTITPYFKDKDGRIWISSVNGLDIYDPYFNQLSIFDFDPNLMPAQFSTCKLVEDTILNKLYFIQSAGEEVYSFDLKTKNYCPPLKTIKNTEQNNSNKNLSTVDLLINKKNDLILLTKSQIYKLEQNKWRDLTIVPKLDMPPYNSFIENDRDELFLLSIYEGMFRLSLNNSEVKHYDKSYFYGSGWWITEGFFDSKENLWVNHLNHGYSIFDLKNDTHEIVFLDNDNPLKIPRVKDQIWINDTLLMVCGGEGGLGLIHRDQPTDGVYKKFTPGNSGLVSDKIYAIEKDDVGRFWMLADIGLQVFDPQSNLFKFFSYSDSKLNVKSSLTELAVLKKLQDGSMVFAYDEGLVFFDPKKLYSNSEQITPLITSIRVLDRDLETPFFEEQKVKLAHNENFITFNFSSIGFTLPEKTVFQHQLSGVDEQWVASTGSRQIKYAHLSSGKYTFSLKAANNDHVWSNKTTTVSFTILPPWWKRWWARLIFGSLLFGLFLYWYDNRKKKWNLATEIKVQKEKLQTLQKQKEVDLLNAIMNGEEKERTRLSRELHDSVGAMLSSIKMYFQTMVRDTPLLATNKTHNRIKELIADTYQEVRNISHNLMPLDIFELGLEKAIKDLCENYNESTDLKISYLFYVDDTPVEREVLLNLYRIIQEILKNTLIHANAKTVLLQLNIDEESIHLEIENDGDIFDVKKALDKNGLGLKNITTRAKYIKGELDIVSNEALGTVFSIFIPNKK